MRDVFPAHAGMNRLLALLFIFFVGVPRARGDEPLDQGQRIHPECVFPAHAGMNRYAGSAIWVWNRVPRARGDEPLLTMVDIKLSKCSPRTRG